MYIPNTKDHFIYTTEEYNEQLRLDGIDFEQDSNAFESDFLKDSDIAYVICDGELDIKKTAENLEEAKIEKFKLDYKDEYPKDIINSFVNFMKEGVDKEELSLMHRIFEGYEEKPSANQFEKNLSDQLEEWREVDQLFNSISRADIPDNVFEQKEILEVLSHLEYESDTGYLWNDVADFENDFSNPDELEKLTTEFFDSDKVEKLFKSETIYFTVGENTYMVDTINSSFSPYNMETLVETIAKELENKNPDVVLDKVTKIKDEFIRVNNIVTDKLEVLVAKYGKPLIKEQDNLIQNSLKEISESNDMKIEQSQEQERGI